MKIDWDRDIKGQNWVYLLAFIKGSPSEELYFLVAYVTQDKADCPKNGLNFS